MGVGVRGVGVWGIGPFPFAYRVAWCADGVTWRYPACSPPPVPELPATSPTAGLGHGLAYGVWGVGGPLPSSC